MLPDSIIITGQVETLHWKIFQGKRPGSRAGGSLPYSSIRKSHKGGDQHLGFLDHTSSLESKYMLNGVSSGWGLNLFNPSNQSRSSSLPGVILPTQSLGRCTCTKNRRTWRRKQYSNKAFISMIKASIQQVNLIQSQHAKTKPMSRHQNPVTIYKVKPSKENNCSVTTTRWHKQIN